MIKKRREFMKFGCSALAGALLPGAGLISWSPRSHAATVSTTFYVTEGLIGQGDGNDVYFRGFSQTSGSLDVPGQSLVVQQGDTVEITVINTLGSSHRLVIDELGVDSGNIAPGSQRTISFTAGQPGSFLYYDSSNAPYNRLLGLHGALAIMPQDLDDRLYPGSPRFSQQYFWLFHDIDPVWHSRLASNLTPNTPYTPRYFTINGLSGRPPGAPGSMDPAIDSMADPRTKIDGHLGDRTLLRCLNAGQCQHAIHTHANHMEWLSRNGTAFGQIWQKDVVPLDRNGGVSDVIFPFDPPPDAWPPVTNDTLVTAENEGRHFAFPMHLHNEMTQTAGGGLYMFGALTDIYYHAD